MISNQSKFELSPKCLQLCADAKEVLCATCKRIESGDITLNELTKIKERNDHMRKLVDETLSDEEKVAIMQLLDIRFKEQNLFMDRLHELGQLCISVHIDVHGKSVISYCVFTVLTPI